MSEPDKIFASYAEVLSVSLSIEDDLAALLDPQSGFAPRLKQLCREQRLELEDMPFGSFNPEERDLLLLEENTWGLLQLIMAIRKTDPPENLILPHQLLSLNPYTPPSTLAQSIMNSSTLLSELVVIREWLQETASQPLLPEATTGYWRFTKNAVMQVLRTGNERPGLVKEMDPDVGSREEGRTIASDDAATEKILVQSLYTYIRAGRLDDALDLCRKAHQPWRAACIRGSQLFRWKAIANEPRNEDNTDEEDDSEALAWSGNRRRKLWKETCIRAALNTNLPDHERILFSALVPSPKTYDILKQACRTWEDHLWAQISVLCEEKESMEMLRLRGSFWEGGFEEVAKRALSNHPTTNLDDAMGDEDEESEWEREAIASLEGLSSVGVVEGQEANHPFHFTQLNVILNRTGHLLEVFAEGLKNGEYNTESLEYAPLCRFFAHLCLFLRLIDLETPLDAVQVILEAYLQVLEHAGQRDLIAIYASALGDHAIERYAQFLVSLELAATKSERKKALAQAVGHGLDMDRVAVTAAELSVEKALTTLQPNTGPLPSTTTLQPNPTDAELLLLRSIEWTLFSERTFTMALEQSNVIFRYFLGAGRLQIAQQLLELLPPELNALTSPSELEETEFMHYRQFFSIWDTLGKTVDCQAMEVEVAGPSGSRTARGVWVKEYQALLDMAYEQVVELLTSDWLVLQKCDARRSQELKRIRQIYIPELIIRLHFLLLNARTYVPRSLKRALEVVNIVADSRYKLYEDFGTQDGKRLSDYLGAVRSAILAGLEGGGSDPFRIVAAPE